MELSYELISQFAKLVTKSTKTASESTVYGTVEVDDDGNKYVKFDGSDIPTPITDSSVDVADGERVSVLIKNHTATVTGNISSPSARQSEVTNLGGQVVANEAYFKSLIADEATLGELTAAKATILDLIAKKAEIEKLIADKITVTDLIASKIDADVIIADSAIIEQLKATGIDVISLLADKATIETLIANKGTFSSLITEKLDADFANIDFANIKRADIEELFVKSGMIQNVTIGEGVVVKELVGVYIKGDWIETGTLKADRLVVKGSDGNYYALNTDFTAMPGVEPVEEDAIHGSVIVAKSIAAEKINVHDLVAFGATIGGFTITDTAIHSHAKTSVDNTTRGLYMDKEGQMAIGDNSNYIKYYKVGDSYKLEISSVDKMKIGARNLIRNSKSLVFQDYYFESQAPSDSDAASTAILGTGVLGTMILGKES